MRKKTNRLYESQYNHIMKKISKEVMDIINECNVDECDMDECDTSECDMSECNYDEDIDECDDDMDECNTSECDTSDMRSCNYDDDIEECNGIKESVEYKNRRYGKLQKLDEMIIANSYRKNKKSGKLDEMSRPPVNRTIDSKAYANVRDLISRKGYNNEEFFNDVEPTRKLDGYQLLNRYVAALLILGKPCPQTIEDIDEIGVFKNYAYKLLDTNEGTLEDIINMYNKNDKVGVNKSRVGRKPRGRKKFGTVSDYDDFDDDETAYNDVSDYSEPSDDFNFDEPDQIAANESYDDSNETEDISETLPDEDEESDETSYDDSTDMTPDELYEKYWGNSLEGYYIPEINSKIYENKRNLIYDENTNQIGIKIYYTIGEDQNEKISNVYADTLGQAIEKYKCIKNIGFDNINIELDNTTKYNIFYNYLKVKEDAMNPEDEENLYILDNSASKLDKECTRIQNFIKYKYKDLTDVDEDFDLQEIADDPELNKRINNLTYTQL